MKKLSMLLVLALILGCACAEPALLGKLEDVSWVDGTNLFRVAGRNGYYIADMNGNALTEDIYSSGFYNYDGLIEAGLYDAESINCSGVLDQNAQTVVPFEYGTLDILNENWVVGYVLKESTADQYDYENYSGVYFLIDYVDIYSVATGAKLSLSRANFKEAEDAGLNLYVQDRASGKITAYDANLAVLGEVDSLYSSDYEAGEIQVFRKNGQEGLMDGDGKVIMEPRYYSIQSFYGDYAEVWDGDECYGLIDKNGVEILPMIYEGIEPCFYDETSYEADGYFCVIMDGKLGYATAAGITCEPKYAEDLMDHNGASATFTDLSGATVILAADGVETPLPDYESIYRADNGDGFYYEVYNEDYDYGLIDWHGNEVFPCAYVTIELSGDGQYALVEVDYNEFELYKLDNGAAAPVAATAIQTPAEPAVETPADSVTAQSMLDLAWDRLGVEAPAAAIEETPAEAQAPAETPAEAPAPASNAKPLLESAKALLAVDGAANQTAILSLLETATAYLSGHPAAGLLEGAKALAMVDAAGNAGAIITLLDNALAML